MGFTRYAKAKLGCEIPDRSLWFFRLSEKMETKGWTWNDMIATVDFLQSRSVMIEEIVSLLFYVEEAKQWSEMLNVHDLQGKVAEAMSVERDEQWLRRLSLAHGKALERVYREWKKERG